RIDETVDAIVRRARVGNIYVNRNIVGAVVGVQPFGGERLSGTGPKAGGPLYLHRLLSRTPVVELAATAGGALPDALSELIAWGATTARQDVPPPRLEGYRRASPLGKRVTLPGPVGEDNSLSFAARGNLLGTARDEAGLVHQLGAALATGNRLLVEDD